MTNFLVKLFIKNKDDIENPNVRENYGYLTSIIGIVSNIILFIIKLVIGLILGSIAVIADSFESLADCLGGAITLMSFKISNTPADSDHPFGHGRAEYISSFIVSFLMMFIGFEFFKSSFERILHPKTLEFNGILLGVLICSAIYKVWLSYFYKKVGLLIDSTVLKTTSKETRNDVITTVVAVIAVIVSHFSGLIIDGYAGVVVALFLIYSGFSIARDIFSELLGKAIDPEIANNIKRDVLAYDGVIGVHDLIVHNYGPSSSMASLHAEVPLNVSIEISHETIDKIEKEVGKKYGLLLVIHMDPINTEDSRIIEIGNGVNRFLKQIDKRLSGHEFRIIDGKNVSNVIFDMEVPHEFSEADIQETVHKIQLEVKKIDERFNCVINVEFGYILEDSED